MKKTMKWAMAAVLSLGLAACPADDSKTEDKGDAVAKKTDEGAAKGDTKQPEKAPASKPSSAAASAPAADSAQAPKQTVDFVWPEEGSKIFEAFHVSFGLSGKSIEMAGKDIDDKNKGHHHLIIDGGPIKAGDIVGLKEKGNKDWVIAVIRWLSGLKNAKTLVGLELLSPRAIPYGACIDIKPGEKSPPVRVLMLAEIALIGQPHTLVTPRAGFKERQKLSLGNSK